MADDFDEDEIFENVSAIADYYSEITGRMIDMGIGSDKDIWMSSSMTNGREYFESVQEAERRLEIMYADYLIDDGDTTDPLGGF